MKTDLEEEKQTFVETALKLSGKSDEEARKTGTLDRADEQMEALFSPKFQTASSPIHRAIWDKELPLDLFVADPPPMPPACQKVMDESVRVVREHQKNKTIYEPSGVMSRAVTADLGKVGYWGMLVSPEYGGIGAPLSAFCKVLTRMITVESTLAGWASIHTGIGAVDPLGGFGTPEQKQRFLPVLASGQKLSGFALTEPGAGSDLTALKTRAVLKGDKYIVNGEKLFITNAFCGRIIALIALIDNRPACLIVELPEEENEHFELVRYKLHCLDHSTNMGLRFKDFEVPAANLVKPPRGDGLTVAYHGLNNGRVALCAMSAGGMRVMLANMLPWASFRKTYGEAIDRRELVQRRIGRMAAMIVGCDALVDWCSTLIHQGYRGEMECIIAKIFGSESQKEAALELFMKTHGGRAFLHGHSFGDGVCDLLAPCIYEGEGEMLGMAFFKSVIKEHGKQFFEPIGKTLHAAGIKKPNLSNPSHLWALREPMTAYSKWYVGQKLGGWTRPQVPKLPGKLAGHVEFAAAELQKSRLEITGMMRKHQLGLADRQCRMSEISQRLQDMVTILVTSLWAAKQKDEVVQMAADVLCQDLTRKLTGSKPSDAYYRTVTTLGQRVAEGEFAAIAGIDQDEILFKYAD